MSAIGASVGRAVGGLGGTTATAAVVAGGLLVGALGGGLLTGLGGRGATPSGQLAVYPCPETGPALLTINAGQQVLATGRTEDSAWLRIHYPAPGRSEAWVEAGPLTVDGSVASLPVAECQPELAIAPPSLEPEASLTAIQNNPPSAAPTAGPTAAPTATPGAANTRPTASGLTASTRVVNFDAANFCPNQPKSVTFRVNAGDATGVTAVTLNWREPGSGSFSKAAMTRVSGSARSGTWQVTLNTANDAIDTAGNLAYFAVAEDAGGATRRVPASGNNAIEVRVCQNRGPDMAGVTSSAGKTLFWNPLGHPNCQGTTTNITAIVRDPDGVASVRLFFRRPGDSSFSSKPMNNTTIPGRWYANLDSLGDKITVKTPPTDTMVWFMRATDGKGVESKIPNQTMTIRRCDTEATIFVNSMDDGGSYCPPQTSAVRIPWQFSISDPDELVRVTLRYTVTNVSNGRKTTRQATANVANGRFNMQSIPLEGQNWYGNNSVEWTVTTRDRYGGTTAAGAKGVFQIWSC